MAHITKAPKRLREVPTYKEELTDKEEAFIQLYTENGGDLDKAYSEAGYILGPRTGNPQKLRRKLWVNIDEAIKNRIKAAVPKALNDLITLAGTAESETVQLNAIKDLMSRGGTDPTTKSTNLNLEGSVDALSDEDIDSELNQLLEARTELKVIEGGK